MSASTPSPTPTPSPTIDPVRSIQPLLVDVRQASRLCGLGRSAWYQLVRAGAAPAAHRLAGKDLWVVEELRTWTAAGCPHVTREAVHE